MRALPRHPSPLQTARTARRAKGRRDGVTGKGTVRGMHTCHKAGRTGRQRDASKAAGSGACGRHYLAAAAAGGGVSRLGAQRGGGANSQPAAERRGGCRRSTSDAASIAACEAAAGPRQDASAAAIAAAAIAAAAIAAAAIAGAAAATIAAAWRIRGDVAPPVGGVCTAAAAAIPSAATISGGAIARSAAPTARRCCGARRGLRRCSPSPRTS